MAETDGGSQNINPSPEAGAAGMNRDDWNRLVAEAAKHGMTVVNMNSDELEKMKRVYGSVTNPNGNIAGKLKKLDEYEAAQEAERQKGMTEVERLASERDALHKKLEMTEGNLTQMGLQVGLAVRNMERVHRQPDKAILPTFLDFNVLADYDGDPANLDAFLDSALDKLLAKQEDVARLFRSREATPGSATPASGSPPRTGVQSQPVQRGSVIAQKVGWRDTVVSGRTGKDARIK
jgi:hypothetical protein